MSRKTLFERLDEAVAGVCIGILGICGFMLVGIVITTVILLINAYLKNR